MPRLDEGVSVFLDEPDWDIFERLNPTRGALGRCYRRTLFRHDFLVSPDSCKWWGQAVFTMLIITANMYAAWPQLGWGEFVVCCTLCCVAFTTSKLVSTTDPGIYPRLQEGEADPLGQETGLVYCKRCCLRRPPRTSHCYVCDVCIREHDHHCEILGGCVGSRSLRWFVTFLLSATSACCMGLVWMIRALLTSQPFAAPGDNTTADGTTQPPVSDADLIRGIVVLTMTMIDACVILLIGGFGCFYVSLTVTSTTRRESKQSQMSLSTLLRPRQVWRNCMRTVFPPPSMVMVEPLHDN